MSSKALSYEERRAVLGVEPMWSREECALFLGVSVRTVDSLPIPRATIGQGSIRFVPDEVRAWARRQLNYSVIAAA